MSLSGDDLRAWIEFYKLLFLKPLLCFFGSVLPKPSLGGNFGTCVGLYTKLVICFCRSAESDSFQPHGLQLVRLLCPWDFPGENTGVGCHFLLQGIFPTQGLNPHLLHGKWILYHRATKDWWYYWLVLVAFEKTSRTVMQGLFNNTNYVLSSQTEDCIWYYKCPQFFSSMYIIVN